jgi:hypothetical protein
VKRNLRSVKKRVRRMMVKWKRKGKWKEKEKNKMKMMMKLKRKRERKTMKKTKRVMSLMWTEVK